MGQSNFTQATFHGGEWSKFFQGRIDHPKYKTGMNVCYNSLPVEEGAWVRRPGTRLAAPTYKGLPGKLLPIAMQTTASYDIEFTDGNIRFFNGGLPVFTEEVTLVSSISTANPALLQTSVTVEWADGDEIVLFFDNTSVDRSSCLPLRNRVMRISPQALSITAYDSSTTYNKGVLVSFGGNNYQSLIGSNLNNQPDTSPTDWELIVGTPANVYALYDSITGLPIDGANLNFSSGLIFVFRLLRIASPYTGSLWSANRIVQEEDVSFLLNGKVQPQKFKIDPNPGDALFAAASIDPAYFIDGPYLDALKDSVATVGDTTGIIEVTFNFVDYNPAKTYAVGNYVSDSGIGYRSIADANIGNTPASSPTFWKKSALGAAATGEDVAVVGLQQKDAGRLVRFYSTPPLYDPATSFAFGDNVMYPDINGQIYQNTSGGALVGVQPDTNPDKWVINPTGAIWTWGKILSVSGPTVCSVQLIGPDLLYNAVQPVVLWRLGVYSDAVGHPTCGTMHEGRLWLGGAIPNRFDASTTDGDFVTFSPTLPDGTVTDANGISYRLLATDKNQIFWFSPEQGGIACGTLGGEWLIQSSTAGDPLTPSSIQAKRVTKYGCANIEPRRTGIALVIVQKYARRLLEFLSDVFTSRYIAPNLSEKAKHITAPGVAEIAYQEELAPILWARKSDGSFAGSTYRRQNSMVTEEPMFNGWHRHTLGTNRTVDSLIVGPSADGKLDTVSLLTADPTIIGSSGGLNQQVHWVEVMTDIFEEGNSLFDAWYVDGGMVPSSMYEDTVNAVLGVRFTGLWYLKGQTVATFAGGLDVGDFLVDDNGTIFVPYGSGTQPSYQDFLSPGAGAWMFTAAYVASVEALNFVPKNGGIFTTASSPTITVGNPIDIPTTSTIQSYVPTNAFSGEALPVATGSAFPNWDAKWITTSSVNPSKGLRTFNMTSGAQVANTTWATLGFGNPVEDVAAVYKGAEGDLLGFVAGNSAYNPFIQVMQSTLALVSSFNRVSINGGTGSGGGATTAAGAVSAGALAGATGQGHNFVIDAGIVGAKIDLIDPDGVILNGGALTTGVGANAMIQEGLVDEGNINYACISNSQTQIGIHITSYGGGAGVVFGYYGVLHTILNPVQGNLLGHQMNLNSKKGKGKKKFSIDNVDLFSPSQSGANYRSIKKIGVINPSQINAAWSHYTSVGGICTDHTDFGTIVLVENIHDRLAQLWTHTISSSVYAGGTTYGFDDIVSFASTGSNTNYYLSLHAGNLGNTPTNNPADTHWRLYKQSTAPAWSGVTTYAQYVIVQGSDTNFYLSLVAGNINFDPTVVVNQGIKWALLSQGYKLGEKVIASDGQIYESLVTSNDNFNPTLNLNSAKWHYSQLQTHYVIKLLAQSPTVLWAVPVTGGFFQDNITSSGNASAGVYIHVSPVNDAGSGIDGSYPAYIIDTTSGAYKVVSLKGIWSPGPSSSNGTSYQVLVKLFAYDSTKPGAPTPLNSTVSFNTSGAAVGNWCMFTIGSDAVQSPIPSNGDFPKPRPIIEETGGTAGQFPCVAGMPYISQGQCLRPVSTEDIKSQEGPGVAKERRSHFVGFLLNNTIGIKFGTAFGDAPVMDPAIFKDGRGKQVIPTVMSSGVYRYPLPDSTSYDSMLAWQINRPYPATVAAIGGFLKTQDV